MQTVSDVFSYEEYNRPVVLVLVEMIELNDGGDNADFSLRSWKNRGK